MPVSTPQFSVPRFLIASTVGPGAGPICACARPATAIAMHNAAPAIAATLPRRAVFRMRLIMLPLRSGCRRANAGAILGYAQQGAAPRQTATNPPGRRRARPTPYYCERQASARANSSEENPMQAVAYPNVSLFIAGAWSPTAAGRTLEASTPATSEQAGT